MSSDHVLYSKQDYIATITLNRPDRLNALSISMLDMLSRYLVDAARDNAVRVIVLTGAGRGFCAGYDLKDEADGKGLRSLIKDSPVSIPNDSPPLALHNLDKPVICAINGAAAGYGMDLTLGCDIRLISTTAKLAPAFSQLGVLPESGGTWLLPRIVGWAKASEIFLRGAPLSADEALAIGLVNRVVEPDRLLDETYMLAAEIASNAPLSIQATKRAMRLGLDQTFESNVQYVYAVLVQLFQSKDFEEGARAFMEKRKPRFEGR
jgi:enoyl-CoA hydratase/carnithine racemase